VGTRESIVKQIGNGVPRYLAAVLALAMQAKNRADLARLQKKLLGTIDQETKDFRIGKIGPVVPKKKTKKGKAQA
jgi:hypothetical protein